MACSDSTGGEKGDWRPRKERYLAHLAKESEDVLRVSLADKLHNARAIVADARTAGEGVWDRFTGDPEPQAWYYLELAKAFRSRAHSRLLDEFTAVVSELVQRARQAPARTAAE